MPDYAILLEKLEKKRQYFINCDFEVLAAEYAEIIVALKNLLTLKEVEP